jgi:ureidoglycolate hydrolase
MAGTASIRVVRIPLERVTPEAWQPFGTILGPQRHALVCTEGHVIVNIMHVQPRPLQCHYLNRHHDHEQLFQPLRGTRGVLFVAPPSLPGGVGFDPRQVRAFLLDEDVTVILHVDTWHAAPYALDGEAAFLNIQGSEYARNTAGLDTAATLGVVFEAVPGDR